MKKTFLCMLCILIFSHSSYANLKDDFKFSQQNCIISTSNYECKQYKKEISIVIKKQISVSKMEIKKLFREVEEEQNVYVRSSLIEQGINSIILELYLKLYNITLNYYNIQHELSQTDCYEDIEKIISPYFEFNKIDVSKIDSFITYAKMKQIQLEKKYNY